jgi:predicted metal-dependent HD superfamily phosphohydrolase
MNSLTEVTYRSLHRQFEIHDYSADEGWGDIYGAYSEPGRVYHNLDHIDEMILWLAHNAPEEHRHWLMWAAIYHDFIDPKADDAVLLSAVTGIGALGNTDAFHEGSKLVFDGIMGTDGHKSDDPFVQWVIDADLQRFRCPDDRYADQIRLEYLEVPDEAFNIGRKAILESFRDRDPIFYYSDGADEVITNIDRQLRELDD